MLKVEETLTLKVRSASTDRKRDTPKDDSHASIPQASTPKHRKAMSRETYEALTRLSDDGCPLVVDLEEYEIIETGSSSTNKHLGH